MIPRTPTTPADAASDSENNLCAQNKGPLGAKRGQKGPSCHLALPGRAEEKLRNLYNLGRQHNCPRDQLLNFFQAGILPHSRQLAASAAARLCDAPDGPKAIGYGGARGGGKTHWLLAQMGADDCQRFPGLKCLLLRKVGKANLENFESLRQRLFNRLPHEFNVSRGQLTFKNGSSITLGHYRCEKDIDSYLGLEYGVIGIEEATQLTARKFEDISTCCRISLPGWRPRIYSTTNPGGIGHQWYHQMFIVPHESRTETLTRFIPARVEDNAFINPEYKDSLANRTGWQYDAWYLGRWDFPAGQFFKNFRPDIHILPDNFVMPPADDWFAAMDYGYTHMNVVLLGCQVGNTWYVIDEHAERYWIPQRHGQAIKAMFARNQVYSSVSHLRQAVLAEYPEYSALRDRVFHHRGNRTISDFVAGTDVFSHESTGQSIADQYHKELGFYIYPADTDRVAGWSAVLNALGDPDHGIPPKLFFHKRCKHLLETLPYLQHDPDRPGDILKTNINEEGIGGDDAADALRYLLTARSRKVRVMRLNGI